MPTILRTGPYRFFFWSSDWSEPRHVHVERDRQRAKFWLDPVALERNQGFKAREIGDLERIIRDHAAEFRSAWDEYFQ